jgi:hypothetical protein
MKKKSKIQIMWLIIILILFIGISCFYYFYPRKVSFELAKEIDKPSPEFDNSQFIGFEYIYNKDRLIYWLVEHYRDFYPQEQCYDSIFAENLANELDFTKYDYLIAYQKQLKELRHSPHLTNTRDGLYHCKETPLIPTWDSVITDKVYIYRIKKNNKFRAPGP